MQLTASEYAQAKAALIALNMGAEVAFVILESGKQVRYFERNKSSLENLVSGYELANGIAAVRTYAKNIRRR